MSSVIIIHCSEELKEWIKELADEEHRTMSSYLRKLIIDEKEKSRQRQAAKLADSIPIR